MIDEFDDEDEYTDANGNRVPDPVVRLRRGVLAELRQQFAGDAGEWESTTAGLNALLGDAVRSLAVLSGERHGIVVMREASDLENLEAAASALIGVWQSVAELGLRHREQ